MGYSIKLNTYIAENNFENIFEVTFFNFNQRLYEYAGLDFLGMFFAVFDT